MKTTPVITRASIDDLTSLVAGFDAKLRAHTNLDLTQSHGNVQVIDSPVFDNNPLPYDDVSGLTGDKVGRVRLRVKVGDAYYDIPADTDPLGPPKVPGITTIPTSALIDFPAGGVQTPVDISVATLAGSLPMAVTIEVFVGSAWVTMTVANAAESPRYRNGVMGTSIPEASLFLQAMTVYGHTVSSGGGPASYTRNAATTSPLITGTFNAHSPAGDYGAQSVALIRFKFSNDGGARCTNACQFSVQDASHK